jgi:hypothetical protein
VYTFLHHIHLLIPFLPSPPTGANLSTPCRTYSALIFSNFVEERKKRNMTFALFHIVWGKGSNILTSEDKHDISFMRIELLLSSAHFINVLSHVLEFLRWG